jgi:hypothetical protein
MRVNPAKALAPMAMDGQHAGNAGEFSRLPAQGQPQLALV